MLQQPTPWSSTLLLLAVVHPVYELSVHTCIALLSKFCIIISLLSMNSNNSKVAKYVCMLHSGDFPLRQSA